MADGQHSYRLLRGALLVIAACALLVVICYYFVDRPVAFFVHRHQIAKFDELRWLTEPPPLVQIWSPFVLALLLIWRAWRPWSRWQHVLFVACVSLIVADQFRGSLGDLFGRYWPETWHDNNPSLIGTGAYGFHPFKVGDDTGSFPSGHATRILAFATVFWLALPLGRWFYAILAVPMLIALVGMNYHFVSDVIAGSALGGIVGAYAVALSALGSVPLALPVSGQSSKAPLNRAASKANSYPFDQRAVVEKILRHMGLWSGTPPLAPARSPPGGADGAMDSRTV